MVYEKQLKDDIKKYESKGWDDDSIIRTLAYKYKIRKGDIEVIMLGIDNKRNDVQGWLRRKDA